MELDALYPIEEFYMTKNRCYKADKRRRPTGIQVHSVGCKGTNRDRWRRWNASTYSKCPNAFGDTNGIMQCLDWDVRPWLSGSGKNGNANDWCVGFEICEPSRKNDTVYAAEYLYGCVVELCTALCREYGIDPANIKCHSELHADGVASNHADVMHWWGKSGTAWANYNMYTLRNDVAKNLGVRIPAEFGGTLRKGSTGAAVFELQKKLNALGFDCGNPDGIFGRQTVNAVKSYQKSSKLTMDGIVGAATWSALFADTVDEYQESGDDYKEQVDEAIYTVIIKHLIKQDADKLAAEYGERAAVSDEK